jgi:hypothetical protein
MHKFQAMGLQGLMGAWGFEWFELRTALEGMEPRP